ncbi:MAG TPA: 16S rRNA (cytidine(1402)-2'-O)-methyltransferase [Steroidobacteraceae bacterium]
MPIRSEDAIVSPSTLYVVATPIGNLSDLTPRAREILGAVDLIAAEDTRHTRQLLRAFGLDTPTIAFHEHNEAEKTIEVLGELAKGKSVALVSDAGTPLISDPGFSLVAAARRAGYAAIAVPGACAAIAALSVSGLPTDRFAFEGFLPAKAAARRERLAELANEPRTLVFYEAPHRLVETLEDMARELGADREASISREITKHFETHYAGTLGELAQRAAADADMQRGELVIVVRGARTENQRGSIDTERLLRALLEEVSPAQAAKIAARVTGEKRSELYAAAVAMAGKGR